MIRTTDKHMLGMLWFSAVVSLALWLVLACWLEFILSL